MTPLKELRFPLSLKSKRRSPNRCQCRWQNNYGFRRLKTEQEIAEASFEDMLKDSAAKKPFKLSIDACVSLQDMKNARGEVLTKESLGEFHALLYFFDDAKDCADELCAAVTQSSNDVVNHWKGVNRIEVRKKKAQEVKEEKEELQKLKEEAAQKAKDIKEKNKPDRGLQPIFLVDYSKISSIAPIIKYSTAPATSAQDTWAKPFILSNHDGVGVWLGDSKVQQQLTKFGSVYKKDLPTGKLSTSLGRTGKRIEDEAHRTSAEEMLKPILPDPVDIGGVEGGTSFMQGHWHYGFLPHPDMSYAGYAPNSAALVRIMSSGKVRVLLIKTSSLVEASQTCGPMLENLDYVDSMRTFDGAKLAALASAGAQMMHGEQNNGELLFLPQGWIVIESSSSNSLTFCYRRSFMQPGKAAIKEYKTAIALFKASARDTARMTAILEAMQAAEDEVS